MMVSRNLILFLSGFCAAFGLAGLFFALRQLYIPLFGKTLVPGNFFVLGAVAVLLAAGLAIAAHAGKKQGQQ